MRRRNVLGRLGTSKTASGMFTGVGTADGRSHLDLDVTVDVSDVEGLVRLADFLTAEQLAAVPDSVNTTEPTLFVKEEAETINIAECCTFCCERSSICDCQCCTCDDDLC